jgi:hypothetical protein
MRTFLRALQSPLIARSSWHNRAINFALSGRHAAERLKPMVQHVSRPASRRTSAQLTRSQGSILRFQCRGRRFRSSRSVSTLSGVLDKAAAFAAAKVEPSVLLQSRLSPDMFALTRRVQIAADQARTAHRGSPASGASLRTTDDDRAAQARIADRGYLKRARPQADRCGRRADHLPARPVRGA